MSPSMELTAFMMPTMNRTEMNSACGAFEEPSVMYRKSGRTRAGAPAFMPPAMRTCLPSLGHPASSSMMSLMMPWMHMAPAPAMTAHGTVVVTKRCHVGNARGGRYRITSAMVMATPPRRGIGVFLNTAPTHGRHRDMKAQAGPAHGWGQQIVKAIAMAASSR